MTSADDSALSSFVERLGFFFSDSNLRRDKWMRAKLDESGGLTLDDLLSFNTIKTISTDKALLAKAAEDADLKDLISYDAEKEVISRRVKFDRETAGDGHELSIVVQNLPLTTPPPEEEKAADGAKSEEEKKAAEDGKSEEEKKAAEDCKPVFKPRYAVNRDEVKALFEPYGKVGIVQLRWVKKHHDRDDDKHAGQDGSRGYRRGESYPLGMAFVEFQNADGMNAACADLIAEKAEDGEEKKESGEGDEAKPEGGEAPRPKTTLELKGNALRISRKKPQGRGRGRGRGRGTIRRSGPVFRTCGNVVELADLAHCNLDSMSNRDIAAFWSALPRLLQKRGAKDPDLEEKLMSVLDTTCDRMHSFQYRDLAQTSLGIAKTVSFSRGKQQYRADDPRQIIRGLLLSESQFMPIFDSIASSAAVMLDKFDARHLSNLIYSFGLVERNPGVGEETLFNVFGKTAVKILHTFKPQELSNMLWAFVKVDAKNSRLFQETGGVISGMDLDSFKPQDFAIILWSFAKSGKADSKLFQALGNHIVTRSLNDFWPQDVSNIVWAYATAGESHPELFKNIGNHAAELDMDSFNPQNLSIIAWAFASAGVPHPELFRKMGARVAGLKSLDLFKPQDLSNTAWSFATARVSHPELLRKIGDHVAGRISLDSFNPQALSNTAWAFATAGVSHPEMFKKIGDHVSGLCSLDSFNPQALSNTVWAFATAGESHPELFKKIGNHIAGLMSLDSFKPQNLSNTAWAFATAGESHSELFEKIGDHVAGRDSLDSFNPQNLSNTAWAYATARVFHSRLFEKLSTADARKGEFIETQHKSNFLWACATVGYTDERLFSAFAPVMESKLDECNEQELANIAWAYSVANVPSKDLFNEGYVGALAAYEKEFSAKEFRQLHQWQLWQQEIGSGMELPQSLQEKCRNAFLSSSYSESKLQNDVAGELKAVGLDLDEEVLLGSGYRVDALVKVGDRGVAIEVDGPSHFIQRRPAGRTILKHRQVARLDSIEVVSVSYWEWDELKNSEAKQHYLHEKLGCRKDH